MFGLFFIIWLPMLLGLAVLIPAFIKWQRAKLEKDDLGIKTGRNLSVIGLTIVLVFLIIWLAVSGVI